MSFVSPESTRFFRSSRPSLGTEEQNTSLRTEVPNRASSHKQTGQADTGCEEKGWCGG